MTCSVCGRKHRSARTFAADGQRCVDRAACQARALRRLREVVTTPLVTIGDQAAAYADAPKLGDAA